MPRYNPAQIEPKWQKYWEEHRTFAAPRLPKGEKLLRARHVPVPQRRRAARRPSGGLHGDRHHLPLRADARPIACCTRWAGTPSACRPKQHAIKTGTPPRVTTEQNIANFRRQLKMLGFSYDWDRELATTDPEYFRWTQWIFLAVRHWFDTWYDSSGRRHAARPADHRAADPRRRRTRGRRRRPPLSGRTSPGLSAEAPVNWCPALGTVLANEEVIDGVSERGGHPVVRIPLRQWMLRITAYADRLGERSGAASIGRRASRSCNGTGSAAAPARRSISSSAPKQSEFSRAGFRLAADAARSGYSRASRPTTCCGSTRRGPTRFSARRTW